MGRGLEGFPNRTTTDGEAFALGRQFAYPAAMNKYSPLVSEFGSAEEEAAYVEWLKKKVAESLADPRPPVPHEEAMKRARATIERAKQRKKAR